MDKVDFPFTGCCILAVFPYEEEVIQSKGEVTLMITMDFLTLIGFSGETIAGNWLCSCSCFPSQCFKEKLLGVQ